MNRLSVLLHGAVSFPFVSRLLGAILLLAGTATAYDALNAPDGFPTVPWLRAASGAGEIAFGLWLLVGLYPRLSWWLLVGCFIVLLGVSSDRALAGEASCGCFGRFHVDAWYAFALDAVAILALALAQPFGQPALDGARTRHRWAVYILLLVVSFVGLEASAYSAKARLGEDGEVIVRGTEVRLSPRDWVGQRFALARHIDIGSSLREGRWALMFYHPECSVCRRTLPEFVGLAYHLSNQDRATRAALIEVPRENASHAVPQREGLCLRGRLSAESRWRVRLPIFVVLDGGTVTKVFEDLDGVYREFGLGGGEETADAILFPDYRKIRREMFLKEIACGPLALMRVLEAFGKPLNEEEAERLVDEAGDKGIDMLRLKQLAEEHGLYALDVAVSTDKLRQMGQRAIVHLDGVGFVPVLGYKRDGVILAYPLAPAGVLPDDLFARSFGAEGKALLISDKPLSAADLGLPPAASDEEKPQGPQLRAERSILAVGRLHRMNWEASLMLTNDGSETLEIKEIKTTCSCFTVSVDRKNLAPGESTQLRAKGVQDRLGGFRYDVLIETNEREGSPRAIPVRGYLEQPVLFNPLTVWLRELLPEEKAEAEIQINLPRTKDVSRLKLRGPTDGPFTGELMVREQGAIVKVYWAGTKKPGLYRGNLEVVAVDAPDAVAVKLPYTVEVVPTIMAYPLSLWIDAPVGGSWTRRLFIESKYDLVGTPSARWSDEASGKAIQTEVKKDGARAVRVTLSGKVPEGRQQMALRVCSKSWRAGGVSPLFSGANRGLTPPARQLLEQTLTVVLGDQSVSVPVRFVHLRE